jgi:hypothetical protein
VRTENGGTATKSVKDVVRWMRLALVNPSRGDLRIEMGCTWKIDSGGRELGNGLRRRCSLGTKARERGLGEWRGGCGCYCGAESLSKRGERISTVDLEMGG